MVQGQTTQGNDGLTHTEEAWNAKGTSDGRRILITGKLNHHLCPLYRGVHREGLRRTYLVLEGVLNF